MKSKASSKYTVLVVEDDKEWRLALASMYEGILGRENCEVVDVDNARSALAALERSTYKLMSVDIDLGSPACGTGMDVVEIASKEKRVSGVVAITGVPLYDDHRLQLAFAGDLALGEQARSALGIKLNALFPDGHCALLQKQDVLRRCIREQIDFFKSQLPLTLLSTITKPQTHRLLPTPYSLDIDTNAAPARITVRTKYGGRGDRREIVEVTDRVFIQALAELWRHGSPSYLSDAGAIRIYRGNQWFDTRARAPEDIEKTAQIVVDTLRKRLRKRGINPDGLFVRERKAGYRLLDLNVIGLGDVGGAPIGDGIDRFRDQTRHSDTSAEVDDIDENSDFNGPRGR